jgi:tellurite resistance protein TerC
MSPIDVTYKLAKRIVVSIVGGTILLIGLIMLVLPGPGLVVIPIGLGILGLEYAWARIWLAKVKAKGSELVDAVNNKIRNGANNRSGSAPK